jgi:hypothetical protein
MKRVLLFALVLGFASAAFAQGLNWTKSWNDRSERGLVQEAGKGEAGLLFDGSMNKGGDTFKPGILDLYGVYAPAANMEVGLSFPILLLKPTGAKMFNSVGPVYFTYQFMDFLAVRAALDIPFEPKFEAKAMKLYIDLLAKYKLAGVPGLALIGSVGVASNVTFDKKVQDKIIPILVGAQYTFIPDFWGQLVTGYGLDLDQSDFSFIPLALKVGYTIQGNMDVGLNFTMNNLKPKVGGAMDSKSLGLFFTYAF